MLDEQQRHVYKQLCADTRSSLEDLPGAMDIGMDGKRKSGKTVQAVRLDDDIYIYIYIYYELGFLFLYHLFVIYIGEYFQRIAIKT